MLQGHSVWADRRSEQDHTVKQSGGCWDIRWRKRQLAGQEREQPWIWL